MTDLLLGDISRHSYTDHTHNYLNKYLNSDRIMCYPSTNCEYTDWYKYEASIFHLYSLTCMVMGKNIHNTANTLLQLTISENPDKSFITLVYI